MRSIKPTRKYKQLANNDSVIQPQILKRYQVQKQLGKIVEP